MRRARRLFTVGVAGDLPVLIARVVGVLCLAVALLPVAVAADDTPAIMRSATALTLAFASCMLLFLASGNLHLLTPAGRAVLLAVPAFMAALYGALVVIGFF